MTDHDTSGVAVNIMPYISMGLHVLLADRLRSSVTIQWFPSYHVPAHIIALKHVPKRDLGKFSWKEHLLWTCGMAIV